MGSELNKYISITVLALSLTMSCTSLLEGRRGDHYSSELTKIIDDFTETKRIKVNLAMHSLVQEKAMGFTKTYPKSGSPYYEMHSYIYYGTWMFVEEIKIKIDGVMHSFKSRYNYRDVIHGHYIEELNYYKVNRDFIKKFVESNDVSIRLYGKDSYMELELKDHHRKLVKRFLKVTE